MRIFFESDTNRIKIYFVPASFAKIVDKIGSDDVMVGDMILTKDQHKLLYSNSTSKRHGYANPFFHWPNGVVPIKIDQTFDAEFIERVKSAADYIEQVSCVRFDFDNNTASANYVFVTTGSGCSSYVGYKRGVQFMQLSPRYCVKGKLIHEMLHAVLSLTCFAYL